MIMIDDYCNITEEEINKIIKPMCIYPFTSDYIIKLDTKIGEPDY